MNQVNSDLQAIKTVESAQRDYMEQGESSIHKGYRDIVKSLVKEGYSQTIKNDSYADALFLTDIMFEHTDRSISMLTGGGADGFIKTLKNRFEDALNRVKENNGLIRIIVVDKNIPECLKKYLSDFSNTLKVRLAEASTAVGHFIVCDDHMLRAEKIHSPLSPETLASAIQADVSFNNKPAAKFVQNVFDQAWSKLNNQS